MVLEVHLHDLVGQAEHDGVLRPHPLLNVHMRVYLEIFTFLVGCSTICAG
jgi:hypothetical protein